MTLADSVIAGDRLALARLLTQVENDTTDGRDALRVLFPRTGKAHLIGVTGAPGTGKSSLVNRLAVHYRGKKKRVAIAAVDPSSPFTGGAVLGDRVRMKDLSGDPDVFIRSMASRGALGGLARTTAGVVQVFDAAGYEIILIETVGAGQAEVDIARLAHTTVVVEAPGLGDDIQAIKAGILEIADILVVNKADRPGADNTEKALKSVLELAHPVQREMMHHGQLVTVDEKAAAPIDGWNVPIQRTVSTDGSGVPELAEHIGRHVEYLRETGQWTRREEARLATEVEAVLHHALADDFHATLPEGRYNEVMQKVFDKTLAPTEAVDVLVDEARQRGSGVRDSGRAA
jgi:LAO/AO transport system kinase